ncbi:hypothetical protein ACFQYP_18230 [Nonomuraea antimicrobica]
MAELRKSGRRRLPPLHEALDTIHRHLDPEKPVSAQEEHRAAPDHLLRRRAKLADQISGMLFERTPTRFSA